MCAPDCSVKCHSALCFSLGTCSFFPATLPGCQAARPAEPPLLLWAVPIRISQPPKRTHADDLILSVPRIWERPSF